MAPITRKALAFPPRLSHLHVMWIALIVIFGAGVANFAMHRAFMESDDPLIQQMVRPLADKVGPNITYVF